MTATEELRALLDGRGVSHVDHGCNTAWTVGGESYAALEQDDGSLSVAPLTPQQAVDATLGRGKCEMEYAADGMMKGWWVCSECGKASDTIESCAGRSKPMFCGNCGKAVKR